LRVSGRQSAPPFIEVFYLGWAKDVETQERVVLRGTVAGLVRRHLVVLDEEMHVIDHEDVEVCRMVPVVFRSHLEAQVTRVMRGEFARGSRNAVRQQDEVFGEEVVAAASDVSVDINQARRRRRGMAWPHIPPLFARRADCQEACKATQQQDEAKRDHGGRAQRPRSRSRGRRWRVGMAAARWVLRGAAGVHSL